MVQSALELMQARIKQLEKDRDEIASERDQLLLDREKALSIYTEWLINCNFIITGNMKIDHVKKFYKALEKIK